MELANTLAVKARPYVGDQDLRALEEPDGLFAAAVLELRRGGKGVVEAGKV